MAKERILVVEDEPDIRELLQFNLEKEGYSVYPAGTGEDGLRKAEEKLPDLILLDLMLPGMDGLEVCKVLKNQTKARHVPVIMLTAKGEESDIVAGLELGADDYVTKPFSPKILIARIRSVLRRKSQQEASSKGPMQRGDLRIDPERFEVLVKGKRVDLTATEFKLLQFLATKPGWVYTRGQIVDSVKGEDYAVTERAVDVQVVGLRKKLGACAEYVETVRGIGYRFKDI